MGIGTNMKKVVVIGGGISGLSSAFLIDEEARKRGLEVDITILERANRPGGKVWSRDIDGYLCEWGPNGFLTNKPQTLDLCEKIGLTEQLHKSNDNARKRFVYSNGKLHKLPHTQLEFLSNSLLTLKGKLRLLAEIFVAKRQDSEDESLASFARRRLGQEALQKLIAPMAGGIFAGDPETMSLQACFPRISELEKEYGSLIKAMLKLASRRKEERKNGKVTASAAGPGGVLTSFEKGLEVLINRLIEKIGENKIKLNAKISSIKKGANYNYEVISDTEIYEADVVICATPAYAAKELIIELSPHLYKLLGTIKYSPLIVACFGYSEEQINFDLNGFGYLLAKGEEIPVLGTLWDSSIFLHRAPDGKILLRTMLGGATRPELINLTDSEIEDIVKKSLSVIMGINARPEMVQIFRHQTAIPQYQLGHMDIVKEIEEIELGLPGLLFTGNAYRGIGINDCVASSYLVAEKAIKFLC